jgi:hypothetical protein
MQRQEDGSEVVEVGVNDKKAHFLVDTGGFTTQISRSLADALGMRPTRTSLRLVDATGNASQDAVRLSRFSVGPLVAENALLPLVPDRDFTKTSGLDGILSTNYFLNYDVDFDFGAGQLNFFKTDHCPGKIFYWKSPARARVPVRYENGQIYLPVTIDGKQLDAILDTGGSNTTLDAGTALQMFGLKSDSPDMEKTGPINGDEDAFAFRHRFAGLSFEGVQVSNPRVDIFANRAGKRDFENDFELGSHIKRQDDDVERPQLVLGMNVLSRLHVYIAYKEKMAYITEAGTTSALDPVAPP